MPYSRLYIDHRNPLLPKYLLESIFLVPRAKRRRARTQHIALCPIIRGHDIRDDEYLDAIATQSQWPIAIATQSQ